MSFELYQTKKVEFESYGSKLLGTLYLPSDFKENRPAVVITGAWTTVKEQMPKTYAVEMAKRGYIALTYDFRGWGESEGKNRYLEGEKRDFKTLKVANYQTKSHFYKR